MGVVDGGIDWDANTVVNRPPILDPHHPDYLDASGLLWAGGTLGNALGDIENAITNFENVVLDIDNAVANATADLITRIDGAEDLSEAARDRANGVWSIVGENDGSGLRASVLALQNSTVGDVTAVTTRVTGLEQIVNATGAQALARMTDLDELETAIDGTYAKASSLNDLTTRVTTAEGVNTAQNTRLSTAETNIAGKANASDLTSLVYLIVGAVITAVLAMVVIKPDRPTNPNAQLTVPAVIQQHAPVQSSHAPVTK